MNRTLAYTLPLTVLLLLLGVLAVTSARSTAVAGPDPKEYAGDKSCRMCHDTVFEGMATSFHAALIGTPGGGCEACHGAGKKHVFTMADYENGQPTMIAANPGKDACLVCHRAVPDRHARTMPVYREKRPDCTVCHDIHVNRANPLFLDAGPMPPEAKEKAGDASCTQCHQSAVASAKASVHGPILPTKGCEACHGPALAHVMSGGRTRFIVRPEMLSPEEASGLCLSCHADKPDHARDWAKGPLAAKGLSCLSCHEGHGAAAGQGKVGGAAAADAKYVGAQACAFCHQNPHPDIAESPHASLVAKGKTTGCEACHGPGGAHVNSGGSAELIKSPKDLPKERRWEFCQDCHGKGENQHLWARSAHVRAGVTCTTCHAPLTSAEKSGKKTGSDLCVACHAAVMAEFRLPNRHPLKRGAVDCVDCHDPHQKVSGFFALTEKRERCYTCHRDKQGPFLFEHEADRTEGCVICHRPHGSMNQRLLTHRQVSNLCIQCHLTPASHNLAQGSSFSNCLNCHRSIHGSYIDKNFFR